MRASTRKILVFLATVLLINVVFGSVMYVIEGPRNGFGNMFLGVYCRRCGGLLASDG